MSAMHIKLEVFLRKKNIVAFICSIDKRNKLNFEKKVNKPGARKCNIVAFIYWKLCKETT